MDRKVWSSYNFVNTACSSTHMCICIIQETLSHFKQLLRQNLTLFEGEDLELCICGKSFFTFIFIFFTSLLWFSHYFPTSQGTFSFLKLILQALSLQKSIVFEFRLKLGFMFHNLGKKVCMHTRCETGGGDLHMYCTSCGTELHYHLMQSVLQDAQEYTGTQHRHRPFQTGLVCWQNTGAKLLKNFGICFKK